MKNTTILCDAPECGKPIDEKNSLAFTPMRGGLSLVINNAQGRAEKQITEDIHLCDTNCLVGFVNKIASDAKPVKSEATAPAAAK